MEQERNSLSIFNVTLWLSMLSGVVSTAFHWLGEEVGVMVMGFLFGVITGFCGWIFMLCVAVLLALPFSTKKKEEGEARGARGKVATAMTIILLLGAPVLVWFFSGAAIDRMI